jgi:fucose permease
VMAFYTMAFLGTAPIGSLIGGVVASRIGAPATIALGGMSCILGAARFAQHLPQFRALVRPVYLKRGIIAVPDIDTGAKAL